MTELNHATLTNLDGGPRGLVTAAGLVTIDAGATRRLALTAAELAAAADSGWFAIATAEAAPRPKRRAR